MRRYLVGLLTVGLLSAVVVSRFVLTTLPVRYVIIHSDDAGMYPSVNRATIDAMERGTVSSCSIMVPCQAFPEFAAYAAGHPEKDFGVHLTLNCETETHRWGPVCPRQKVASLVDSDGCFWSSTDETLSHANIKEVERELHAQIDKALAAGVRVSHLDHHMFVLCERVDFLRLYIQLGQEYNLPLRYTETLPSDALNANNPLLVAAYFEGLRQLRTRDMPVFRDIEDGNYHLPPERKRQYYLAAIRDLKPGVTEILIHCGYGPVGPLHAPDADRREADTRVFMSQEMADWIRRCHVTIIDWKAFRALGMHKQSAMSMRIDAALPLKPESVP
jgi:chitin disaccharide deacetylase